MSLLELIERLPDQEALTELLCRPDSRTLDAVDAVCERASAVSLQRPNDAVQIAEVAVDLAGALPPFWSKEVRIAARSKALRICGACHRLINDFEQAERALIVALRHLRPICSDPPVELTEIYLQFAALRADQRRHLEAAGMARRGVVLSYGACDPELIGKALVTEGNVSYLVDPPKACRAYREAVNFLSDESDWRFNAVQGYGVALAESGDEIESDLLDNILSELSKFTAKELEAPGLRTACASWTRGLLLRKISDSEALADLSRATYLFRLHGVPGHFAIASIDFAVLAATTGRSARAKEAILLALDGLEAFNLTKEQNVATLVLAKAARDECDLKLLQMARDRFVGRI